MEELKKIKSGTRELREFGVVIGAILIVFADLAMLRGKAFGPYLLPLGIAFCVLGLIKPAILKPLQKVWMGLGIVLGFFMSRVVLTVLYFGVMMPIGFIMRVSGKDILDERIEKDKVSYWKERPIDPKPKESYENQY